MSLENQVATLVSSTTALHNIVAGEVTKVRAENTTLRAEVVERAPVAASNQLVVFDGTSGKNIKNNPRATINDNGGATFDAVFIGSGTGGRHPSNCIVGRGATLPNNTTGTFNTGFGTQALLANTTGYGNVAVGVNSLFANTTGGENVCLGVEALSANLTGNSNTAIGHVALTSSSSSNLFNCTGLGRGAEVTGNNQIQLGNSATTTFVFNTVQSRSDRRDKTDIRPTVLGLDFIKALRPVDFRWDMRDFYRTPMPEILPIDATEEQKLTYEEALKKYQESNKLSSIIPDGSKKKKRLHHGLIAQEVQELIKSNKIEDFGGFQDHKISGGDDVLSIGYDELIAPLIKAVQELAQANEELRDRIATLEARK